MISGNWINKLNFEFYIKKYGRFVIIFATSSVTYSSTQLSDIIIRNILSFLIYLILKHINFSSQLKQRSTEESTIRSIYNSIHEKLMCLRIR